MAKTPESLPVRFAKNPWVWSGMGLVIRYYDDPSAKAVLWKTLGILSLAIGVGTSVATQSHSE